MNKKNAYRLYTFKDTGVTTNNFWRFDVIKSIEKFLKTVDSKNINPLHLSFLYVSTTDDGLFLKTYSSFAKAQHIFLDHYNH